ncbi:MAG: hypothetical protein HY561_08365 [Gemmatimonadetes bacterium]|nr:hypothetical protein [Gemmatimonadota bacterium]
MWWFVIAVLALMIPLVTVVLDSQLGRALAARLERDALPADRSLGRRLAALEAEVERLNRELQNLEEHHEFLQRLLESKGSPGVLPAGEHER